MTRRAVVSDVHGNLPALEAVLDALPAVDEIVCAGDLVGYGPFPNECVALVREAAGVVVAGNHDLVAVGRMPDTLDGLAGVTMEWTRRALGEAAAAYLRALPGAHVDADVHVVHGSLERADEYVSRRARAREQLRRASAPVVVAGHTHRPLVVRADGRVWLNPGAVGQSRERRLAARFALLDGDRIELRRVPYDVERTRAALRAHGLPEEAVHLRPSLGRALVRALRR